MQKILRSRFKFPSAFIVDDLDIWESQHDVVVSCLHFTESTLELLTLRIFVVHGFSYSCKCDGHCFMLFALVTVYVLVDTGGRSVWWFEWRWYTNGYSECYRTQKCTFRTRGMTSFTMFCVRPNNRLETTSIMSCSESKFETCVCIIQVFKNVTFFKAFQLVRSSEHEDLLGAHCGEFVLRK